MFCLAVSGVFLWGFKCTFVFLYSSIPNAARITRSCAVDARALYTWASDVTLVNDTISKAVARATGSCLFIAISILSVADAHRAVISCVTWCCIPCALTQDSREVGLEEKSPNNGYL